MFALSRGGDCETIEQYVFALFAECVAKIQKNLQTADAEV